MRQALALLSAVLIVGCGAPEVDRAPGPSDDGSAVLASFPSNAPDHFGFGSDASAARVAMWDIDVKPDGEGLPPGSGTVAQGQRVFLTHCVACHGATGTEGPNDRLVGTAAWEQWPNGQTVGNYWPYATTLYDYIRRAMPQQRNLRGSRLHPEHERPRAGGRRHGCGDPAGCRNARPRSLRIGRPGGRTRGSIGPRLSLWVVPVD